MDTPFIVSTTISTRYKYRRAALKGAVAERTKEILQEIAERYEFELDTMKVIEDHVHIFLSAPPRYAPAQIGNILKSDSAKKIFEGFAQVKKVLWGCFEISADTESKAAPLCGVAGYSLGMSASIASKPSRANSGDVVVSVFLTRI